MELIIDNWNKMSIADYCSLQDIASDKEMEAVDTEIAIVSLLCGVSEEEILNLPIPEYQALRAKAQFIANFPEIKVAKAPKKIFINGKECTVATDLTKITTAQYIDFQTYFKLDDLNRYLPNILACFIIPKGYQYADGYEISEFVEEIRNNLSIIDALQMCSFFQMAFLILMNNILRYSEKAMRKAKKKMPKEKIAEMESAIKKMEETRSQLVGVGYQLLTK